MVADLWSVVKSSLSPGIKGLKWNKVPRLIPSDRLIPKQITSGCQGYRNGAAAARWSSSLHACQREGWLLNRAHLLRRSECPRSVHSSDGQLGCASQHGNVQSKVRAQAGVPPEPRRKEFSPLPRETGWTPLPCDALCSDVCISASSSLKWQSIWKIRLNSNHKCTEAVNSKRVELQQTFRNTIMSSRFFLLH